MRHLFVFITAFIFTTNILTAQVNQGLNHAATLNNGHVTPDREQVETFISNHYAFPSILDSLDVMYDYNFNEALTTYVREHIQNFYKLIYDGVANHTITSKDQVKDMFVNFLDSTGYNLAHIDFPKDPPVSSHPPEKQLNGPCVNMDFEDGSMNGWSLFDGQVDGSAIYSYTGNTPVGPGASHLITSGGTDPNCPIPMVNPAGGSYSCRLGDGNTSGNGAARMTQSFMVTPQNSIFSYSYAVVLQDPGHTSTQQPYFTLRVFDQNGNNVNCGAFSVYASSSSPFNFLSGTNSVLYSNWTTVFSQLNSYVGQNITIEFTTGDCSQGGHFGYAYVDANCQPFDITTSTGDTILCEGSTMTLYAPQGGTSYLWSTGATTQNINITTAGHYSVDIVPFQGAICAITIDIDVTPLPTPVPAFTSNPTTICAGEAITFTDQSTITPPATVQGWQWDFGDGIITPESSGNVTGVAQTTGTYTAPVHTFSAVGTYNVVLTASGVNSYCSASVTHQIVVGNGPALVVAGTTTICDGQTTTLTASGANTYSWNNGITNGVAFTPPLGQTTYTVTGTSVSGCEATLPVIVTKNPNPTPVISGTAQYCAGQTTALDAGAGFSSYLWSTGGTTQTGNFTIANNPITVTVQNAQGCQATSAVFNVIENAVITTSGSFQLCQGASMMIHGISRNTSGLYSQTFTTTQGCDSTSNITLTVNPLPLVNAGTDQTHCAGIPVTLSATGANTFTWDNGVPNGVPFTQTVGTTTYTVTGTDANGCINTDAVDVIINAIPVLDAGVDQAFCDGLQATLTASGATSYTWDHGVTNGVAFTQPVGTTTYTVTGTSLGCTSTDQVLVTVYALPNVAAGNSFVICDGATAILTGSGASTYTWDNGVTNGVSFTPTTTATYNVIGTDIHGCINTSNMTLTVVLIPTMDFFADKLKGCSPLTVNFTNNSTGNLTNCEWSFSNGTNLNICGNVSQTFTAVGCYDVTLTVRTQEGCANTMTIPDYICVDPNPIADFSFDPKELSTVNWIANMTNSSIDAISYNWNFGDGTTSTEIDPIHSFPYDGPGTYNIVLFATNIEGCIDSIAKPIVVTEDLIFYVPNTFTPDHDDFNEVFKPIFTSGFDPFDYTLLIFNRWGEVLFESHDTDFGWDGTYGGKTEDGIYIWKIIVKRKGIDKREEFHGNVNLLK